LGSVSKARDEDESVGGKLVLVPGRGATWAFFKGGKEGAYCGLCTGPKWARPTKGGSGVL